ncbi:cytochrome o ubiquinol oxidase subunit I [Candidatus Adlerbacteria bacterium RIFCSPLOWO2_01_FULL_51_16]|uniref:Cytochrome o ubiquinol oxidase subunit I n=1 Tax=Candidatus Adlerbacteria bacterium RIFCSPLOWO2_01_FULL_51_16 TaxID=1797243 RepID=A0A1F4XH15_9BACT|nr:MAG: cytochrome o ubiquinol oxidase subunit I [Candidatus Adlerbacteria bacterium RIFCSPLOWO2_01_FULL_51_16]
MFGKLTPDAFIHGPVETGAQLIVVVGALVVIGLLFYTKSWGWLYRNWLTSVDHKKIGVMYLVLSFVMLMRGAMDALMMRAQQVVAVGDSAGYLSPDHYSQIFTAHGVIMIFFVAMPFMFGLINLIVPLQIGSRDVAYPFLNSMSLWLTVAGAMLMNLSLVAGEFAAVGWLAYPPLSELQFSPGVGVDYYIWALQIAGVGTLLSGINFLVTIIKMRAPGMWLMRMPIFVWTVLGSMLLVIFAFPILTATLGLLSLDRIFGMHFFTTDLGGSAMMYVNLIWAWGHPEVYILILPAFGIFSEIVPVFSQKKLFGYTSMVVATLLIVILSFVVWVHHFFTMGAGANVNAFFGIMTMVIAIPTGVKVFNWLFTMFRGRIVFATPMLWFMGFLTTFILGGMTGVLMAIPGADFQLHNSLFLVAHFHNMIIGGVLFGFFAGFVYWFPKIFGFTLNERLGKWAFWNWIVGFLLAFIPLYALGLMGMTRRLSQVDPIFQPLLIVAAVGACVIALGMFFQILQLIVSVLQRKKNIAGPDPWPGPAGGGRTLEWATSSPPPHYNFASIPRVHGRDAFWVLKEANGPVKEGKTWPERRSSALEAAHERTHIEMPKYTPVGFIVAGCAFLSGFGIVWHIWWLALLGLVAIAIILIARSFESEIEYTIAV